MKPGGVKNYFKISSIHFLKLPAVRKWAVTLCKRIGTAVNLLIIFVIYNWHIYYGEMQYQLNPLG